jgi:hypothetical protein
MGLLETNGDLNYRNWEKMLTYHPVSGASWTHGRNGVFELGEDFYKRRGGIYQPSSHYQKMLTKIK